ncbi:ATP-grasp domain-containing protein [Methanobrevibacter olleyae]|uniref:ATP-grasp domain-containing protein n=1 Tax=Methanobrevibacter olleyae TaxID=294671 RepID=A0A126QZ07_METOL|nr:ATP-grasp domain-containing protein [Methanobrevibacter olleyae]AMK14909.1 ATP-grasp domain-containing protein [Methanobrevibacter olleyae]SFL43925.1 hypothetical protein SAMN02910297_00881 [Methanobrevibacter olleyae]
MENLLIMGINTRPMVNSALKLDYRTFSLSYFKTLDFKMPYAEKHLLDQESAISCGKFEDNYSPYKLLELSKDFLYGRAGEINNLRNSEIDKIVLTAGINLNDFCGKFKKFRKIVCGNKNTHDVDNKFRFYKKLRNKFNIPLTFQASDVDEICEILKEHSNSQFILKPIQGGGGLGIFMLNNGSSNEIKYLNEVCENISLENYMLQEYIEGINLSSSVLSSHSDRKNLINSRLITESDLGKNSFEYSGNILPLDENSFKVFNNVQRNINSKAKTNSKNIINPNITKAKTNSKNIINPNITKAKTNSKNIINPNINIDELNDEMKNTSEDLIKEFKLIGSNGVDYILDKNGELKIIEINPRLQGTYELVEEVMNINLLDAHIKACEGELIDVPQANQYSIKKIIYARKQVSVGDLNIPNVRDIPFKGVKIENNQPVVTIISSNKNLNTAINYLKIAEKEVYKNIE